MRYEVEIYECPKCERNEFPENWQNCGDWKCPDCDEPVYIRVADEDENRRVVVRKSPSQLKVGDLVAVRGGTLTEPNQVLEIKEAGGRYKIALKGYTVLSGVTEDSFFNCVIGAW